MPDLQVPAAFCAMADSLGARASARSARLPPTSGCATRSRNRYPGRRTGPGRPACQRHAGFAGTVTAPGRSAAGRGWSAEDRADGRSERARRRPWDRATQTDRRGSARSRASMREVADLADVAISSVSRVLSGHPDVSAQMRERVLSAVGAAGVRARLPRPEPAARPDPVGRLRPRGHLQPADGRHRAGCRGGAPERGLLAAAHELRERPGPRRASTSASSRAAASTA